MKIYLAGYNAIDNPKNWSGTHSNLKIQLDLQNINYEYIDFSIHKNILRFYFIIWGKFFYVYNTCRNYIWNLFAEKSIVKKTAHISGGKAQLIFIADYCIPQKIADKFIYSAYIDSCLFKLMDSISDKRFGVLLFKNYYYKKSLGYLQRMSIVFTQNEWTKDSLVANFYLDPQKVFNIGFGVNLIPYYGEKNYSNDLLLIVLRKGTEKYKGLNLLIDAFKILKRKRSNVRLAVVGTELMEEIEGVTCYYSFPREKTIELFIESTLYVMPALSEPNGMTYLEALANKTPIVGLNRFAFPEFSGYGEWGFVVENEDPMALADLINSALDDKERLKLMGDKGQQFVLGRYHWDIVVEKMISILEQYN